MAAAAPYRAEPIGLLAPNQAWQTADRLREQARDWADPELARIIGKTQRSPAAVPRDRVKFLKLAWDAIGSEFGSRHTQYEMFYAGARYISCSHSFRTYEWVAAGALVDLLLGGDDQKGAIVPPGIEIRTRLDTTPLY